MNGLLNSQVSGNDWSKPTPEMLYQVFQGSVPAPLPDAQHLALEQFGLLQEQLEQEMAQFEADHEALVMQVRRSYVLLNDHMIRDFLKSHRTAPQLLIEAVARLRRHFGAGTVFNLRVTADEFGAQTLYAVVIWPGEVGDVRTGLEHFDEDWWIANSRRASGDVVFTYELV